MFARSLEDIDENTWLTYGQECIAEELKESGHTLGFWFYNEWAVAKHESYDGDKALYWEITTDASLEDMHTICRKVRKEIYEATRCYHEHDCCGCSFISSLYPSLKYEREESTYIICETWGINV